MAASGIAPAGVSPDTDVIPGLRASRPTRGPSWPGTSGLGDGVLALRPMTADDWPVVLEDDNNPESRRWALTSNPTTEAEARALAVRAVDDWRTGRAARLVMVDEVSGAPAGLIAVVRMGPPGVGLVAYGVLPRFRGRGFTTRALRLLSGWVFAGTDLARLELGHKDGNEASGRSARNAGFVREGHFARRLRNPDGSYSDETFYGLPRPDSPG